MERAHQRIAVLQNQVGDDTTLSFTSYGTPTINGELFYSVALPEKLTSNDWHVHRHTKETVELRTGYDPPADGIRTTYDSFETTLANQPEARYLGTREEKADGQPGEYTWITYAQAAELRTAIGSALLEFGLSNGSKVGLCSANCQEWMLVDLACHAYSLVTVPLYDTLGPDAVDHILGHAEVEAVACSEAVLPSILECLPQRPAVKLVVVYGLKPNSSLPSVGDGGSFRMLTLDELIQLGKQKSKVHIPPAPQDLALLCYTSGTTGVPKGAMISHSNLTACGANHFAIPSLDLSPADVHISYLPLAHIYERGNITAITRAGASIGFFRGDVLTLLDDIQELQPTIFASVPRLYNRIYDRVMNTIDSGNPVSRALFYRAFSSKQAAVKTGDLSGGSFGAFWDRLVFSKIKARLGGSAPLSANVMDFLRICFGCLVIEGYGLTETTSAVAGTAPEEHRGGHVGGPAPSVELKLADIPDMKYTNADLPSPRGEICVRGATVFQGYYKDEQNTAEAFDDDGWFHTGDVGAWLSGGRLQIIDRKKAMFKLAQGEYVAAEKIENVISRSQFVAQAFVYGDSLQSKLVAIIIPDFEVLQPWAAQRKLPSDTGELCKSSAVKQAVFRSITEEGRTAKLRGFEQRPLNRLEDFLDNRCYFWSAATSSSSTKTLHDFPVAAIHLDPEPFSVQNGLQTPTFKLKRPQAKDKFKKELDDLYQSIPKE